MTTTDFPESEPEPVVVATCRDWKEGEVKPAPASMDWVTPDGDEDPTE